MRLVTPAAHSSMCQPSPSVSRYGPSPTAEKTLVAAKSAHEVGRARRYQPEPAVQHNGGWATGYMLTLQVLLPPHPLPLYLDKVGVGAALARSHSQCMRLVYHSHYHWFGFGICFEAEATRGAGGYQEDDSMVARNYQWSDISIPSSKKRL